MAKAPLIFPKAELPPPPHLEDVEKKLWSDLTDIHCFDDAASVALLRTTLEAHQRARRCREKIDADGETILDRFDQVKPHPLLPAERDARAAFLSGMKALNLDLGGTK
jgi:hypothetical protein